MERKMSENNCVSLILNQMTENKPPTRFSNIGQTHSEDQTAKASMPRASCHQLASKTDETWKTWMTRSQFAKCDKFEIELWISRQTYACG